MLSVHDVASALPSHLKSAATQNLVDMVNNVSQDPDICEHVRENFVTYATVLKEGKFKVESYVDACSYVTYKMMGYSNMEAYARTFPARYNQHRANGVSDKDISTYVSVYHRGRLVSMIMERAVMPAWVLNQDVYQLAINEQYNLMTTAKSEKVRCDAANSLLTHLKKPEKHEVDLNVNVQETSGMKELKYMLTELAQAQKTMITDGARTRDIAHQKLGPVIDVVADAELIPNTPEEEDQP